MRKTLLTLLIILPNAFAQSNLSKTFIFFDRDNSPLSSNKIINIYANKNNIYWFVTGKESVDSTKFFNGHLHRFYNNEWTIFNHTNSPLDNNIVEDITETIDGKLLIATSRGLYIRGNNTWDSLNTGNSLLPDNFIFRISVDRLNRYWLGIPNYGIAVYTNGNWTFYSDQNSFIGISDFNFIEVDSLNKIWVGTDFHGLYSFDGNNWVNRIKGIFTGGPWQPIVGLAIDSQNQKWVSINTEGGGGKIAKSIDDASFVYYVSSDIGFSFSLLSYDGVAIDKKNVKYFGTTEGLLRYDDANWTRIDTSNSPIPANWFRVGYVDSRNNKIFGLSSFTPPRNDYGLIFYNEDSVVTSVRDNYSVMYDYKLYQNYPNPFNPMTRIKYSIPGSEIVQMKIYNMLGSEIKTLFDEYKQAGNYEIEFDASNLPSGVYFYRVISRSYADTKKMILLR